MAAVIKKRIKSRIVSQSYAKFCELIDNNHLQDAAKLTVYLAIILFPGELFRELRYANMLFKFKKRRETEAK